MNMRNIHACHGLHIGAAWAVSCGIGSRCAGAYGLLCERKKSRNQS